MTVKKPEPKPTTPERKVVVVKVDHEAKTVTHVTPKHHGWNCEVCGTVDIAADVCPVDGSAR